MPATRSVTIDDRITVPGAALDHAGYRAWVTSRSYPDGVRTTYIEGEVLVEMSPESIETHNKVKTALTAALELYVRERDLGEVFADGVLVTNEPAGLSAEPDLTFVAWSGFEAGRVRLERRAGSDADFVEITGSPDLVVEIVSDSSVTKDTRHLREVYGRAHVLEYWLIDARGPDITFEILSAGEMTSSCAVDEPPASRVLGDRWSLTRTSNRVGRYQYTLARIA
jgi:Uma2 family endonuclease